MTKSVEIHPSAIVAEGAELGTGVSIGPFSIVGAHVKLGDGAKVHSHAVLDGYTTIGGGAEIYPQACVGLQPQDLKFDGSATKLFVGARTVIRECVTLQPGAVDEAETHIGSDCLLMAYCHVAHDCVVGNQVIMANATQVAGHCTIEDGAIIGGVSTIHQFCRIGKKAITGASSRIVQDVPPYMMADGHPAKLHGLNKVGLKRAGISEESQKYLKQAYKEIFLKGPYREALQRVENELAPLSAEVSHLVNFLNQSERGVTRAPQRKK